jgi:hypothetical protein
MIANCAEGLISIDKFLYSQFIKIERWQNSESRMH